MRLVLSLIDAVQEGEAAGANTGSDKGDGKGDGKGKDETANKGKGKGIHGKGKVPWVECGARSKLNPPRGKGKEGGNNVALPQPGLWNESDLPLSSLMAPRHLKIKGETEGECANDVSQGAVNGGSASSGADPAVDLPIESVCANDVSEDAVWMDFFSL